MEPILTDDEITTVLTAVGYKKKEQPNGTVALSPYVFSGAHVLVELALSKTLVLRNKINTKHGVVLEGQPTASLNHVSCDYTEMSVAFAQDMAVLQPLLDSQQLSINFRQINSSMLWNVAVMDKHDDLVFVKLNNRLGHTMHELIEHLRKVASEVTPNESFF